MNKKTVEEEMLDASTLCTLKAEDYWEWRTTMEEIEHARTMHSLVVLKFKLMEQQSKILNMEMALFRSKLGESAANIDKCKADYIPYKEKLEKRYKISLKNATIRDDFRVIKLPEDAKEIDNGPSKTL